MLARTFVFGQHTPQVTQIFFKSKLTYGFVNLKPVLPGTISFYDIIFLIY